MALPVNQVREVWNFTKIVGLLIATTLLVLFVGGMMFTKIRLTEQNMKESGAMPQSADVEAATEAQREAASHANDPWWDPTQPGGLKPFYFGKEYTVSPGQWTSIDVTSPVTNGLYKYIVVFQGIDRFRVRPNGDAEREFVYPNAENLQPYQLSGWCQTYLVQPLDNSMHRIRVKYVRVPRSQ
jgi:hypothetical protein